MREEDRDAMDKDVDPPVLRANFMLVPQLLQPMPIVTTNPPPKPDVKFTQENLVNNFTRACENLPNRYKPFVNDLLIPNQMTRSFFAVCHSFVSDLVFLCTIFSEIPFVSQLKMQFMNRYNSPQFRQQILTDEVFNSNTLQM